MVSKILFGAILAFIAFVASAPLRSRARKRAAAHRDERLHRMVTELAGGAALGGPPFGSGIGPPSEGDEREAGAASEPGGERVKTRRYRDDNGAWVEETVRTGSFPGGSFSFTRSTSTTTSSPRHGDLLDSLFGGGADRFRVVPTSELPTFADVGGMEELKREIRETIGLILEHGEGARRYGITWNGLLLHGPPGVGKTFLARALAGEYGLNLLHVSTGDLVVAFIGQSAKNVQRAFQTAAEHRPCLLFFDEFDSIAQRRDGGTHQEERRTVNQLLTSLEAHRETPGLVVMAATNDLGHLDRAVIRPGRFDRHVRIDLPDAEARRAILAAQLRGRPACHRIDLDEVADRTAGMTPAALAKIVDAAALSAFKQAASQGVQVEISMQHVLDALEAHGGEDRPTVEDWDWEHLILPPDVKSELQQLQAMLEDTELARSFGVEPPSGVLLAGPPGTGKTTVARVLAAQARCSFYPVSAADVISKWVGESEGNIRRLFERARTNRPSIIFIDELDALASRRGHGFDGADRLLNQLLVEIDGLSSSAGILVIGATNRPELIDPALLRGGRLSRTIRIELPDAAAREAILRLNTERMPTVDVDPRKLAAATAGLSGADLKALCQQAALHAMVRTRREQARTEAAFAGTPGPSSTAPGAPAGAAPTPDGPSALPSPSVLMEDFERAIAERGASRGA